jgi:hypothetical protein
MLLNYKPVLNVCLMVAFAILLLAGVPYVLHHVTSNQHNSMANGLLADMLITFPAAYYFFIIRPFKLRLRNLLLVFTCCCGVAYMIMPLQQQLYILQLRKATVLLELGIVVYAISKINNIITLYKHLQTQVPDMAFHLQQSIIGVLGNSLPVRMLASEITVLRFALLCWIKGNNLPFGARPYSTHKESGYAAMFCVLLFVMLIELTAVHLLLISYSELAAYIVSALTLYGMLFFVADISAVVKSPVWVSKTHLLLRTGMRWRLYTELDNINAIVKLKGDFEPGQSCFKGAIIKSNANLHISFKQPVVLSRLYRPDLIITNIVLTIDETDAFIAHIATSLSNKP